MICIIHIKGDSAALLYLCKMPGVEDDPSTQSKMTTAEYYDWDSRIRFQVYGPKHTASLGSRRKVVDLVAEVEVIDNDVVDEDDGKEAATNISPFSRGGDEHIECRVALSQTMEVEHSLRDINNVHRDNLVQSFEFYGFDYINGLSDS